ncbi:hypothetical protein [Microbacterium sp.]|uniref:hypothetical protein n=1 Tax=Microbacterium sp. TaxID=51671 RepID=UPI00333F0BD0
MSAAVTQPEWIAQRDARWLALAPICPACASMPFELCKPLPAVGLLGVHEERAIAALTSPGRYRRDVRRWRAQLKAERRGYEKREATAWHTRQAIERIHAAAQEVRS